MTDPAPTGGDPTGPPLSSGDGPLDFDPYRYGAPEHPVPPEFAPPGYQPPAPTYAQPPYGSPYPAPYAPTPPAYSRDYPPPSAGNGKATAALVLGIASIPLCFLTILDIVPIVLAIIFGVLGRAQANRTPRGSGRGAATAGLACAIIGAVLATVLTVYLYNRIKPCLNEVHNSTAYNSCIRSKV